MNTYVTNGDVTKIKLTQGQWAVIDTADIPSVQAHRWHAVWAPTAHGFYAGSNIRKCNGTQKSIKMHQLILPLENTLQVDRINGDGLDNRKINLRPATPTQNQYNRGRQRNNTSGFTGVSFKKSCSKWQARITLNGKLLFLGYFDSPRAAYSAYRKSAEKYHGEFAKL